MIIEYCHFESLNQLRLMMKCNVMLRWYQWTSMIIHENILLWGLWLERFRDYITSEGPFFSPSRVPVSSKQLHSVTRSDWQYCYPSISIHNNFMLKCWTLLNIISEHCQTYTMATVASLQNFPGMYKDSFPSDWFPGCEEVYCWRFVKICKYSLLRCPREQLCVQ